MQRRAIIAVTPPSAAKERTRLLRTLEQAFPARFTPRETPFVAADADAIVAFGPLDETSPSRLPPTMVLAGTPITDAPPNITFSASSHLDHRLQGRTLTECSEQRRLTSIPVGAEVLAMRGEAPIWAARPHARGVTHFAVSYPDELQPHEPLREHLRAQRFEHLLPLVHFLRAVTAEYDWKPAPLRALLMFDDPNLHWPSYGHVDYRALVDHAQLCNYHAVMAMIPLDGWYVQSRAARLFREHPNRLSLMMHGLEHAHCELLQPQSANVRERAVARALRRIEAFERRAGLYVSKITSPPHGWASEEYLETLLRFRLEAVFANVPFPWPADEASDGQASSHFHPRNKPLSHWHPVSFVAGGMPVIPRLPFRGRADDIVLRAFLGHPLVLCGHHDDLAEGLAPIERAAALVNSLGRVQWGSATSIGRENFETRRDGDVFCVRLLARCVDVTIPDPAERIEIDLSLIDGLLDRHEVVVTGPAETIAVPAAQTVTIETSASSLRVELRPRNHLDCYGVRPARPKPWPFVRRTVTESRDRIRPVLH